MEKSCCIESVSAIKGYVGQQESVHSTEPEEYQRGLSERGSPTRQTFLADKKGATPVCSEWKPLHQLGQFDMAGSNQRRGASPIPVIPHHSGQCIDCKGLVCVCACACACAEPC